ncbi:sialate O-acetylesterase [Bradyrhizobium sp. WSM3983]|uniref:sialate O-acetylesterase n=1 Tax=Bradyrhizobium sp. WSM3983 TaxID=1038867 RepID=UPI000429E487|nr:sialate O-acetylesterase [Bradyrhizobium sp. WSM3983]
MFPLVAVRPKRLLRKTNGNSKVRNAQVLIGIYGQSNAFHHYGGGALFSNSPPAANAGTSWFDGTSWSTTIPNYNGIRELMNGINSAAGKTVGALGGAVSGQAISLLSKGNASYTNFINSIVASGGVLDFIVWYQGEGDSANGNTEASYRAQLSQLHADIVADLGTTKAACPLVLCSLANTTDTGTGAGTDASWDLMEGVLIRCGSGATQLPNVYYSHSNRDAMLASGDQIHIDGTSLGRSGKRFAKTIASLLASTTAFPNWHIVGAAIVDATHTDVTFVRGLGSDFTPTSNPSGFELSGDNGGTWAAATAGARQSAIVLRLTHASLATTSARKLRYQYGRNPDASAPVLDNSSLALPLDNSGGNIAPTPLASLPTPTWSSSSGQTSSGGATQQLAAVAIPAAARNLVIVTYTGATDLEPVTVTVAPNVGTAKTATRNVYRGAAGNSSAGMASCVLDADADTATSVTVTLDFGGANPFGSRRVAVYTVPSGDLSSPTPVASNGGTVNSGGTVVNASFNTSAGGFYIVCGASNNITSNTGTLSATGETPVRRIHAGASGALNVVGDASGLTAQTPDTVTLTCTAAGAMALVGASWR